MNPNEEGQYYMHMARKYKSEDGERSLSQFCKEEGVSCRKMQNVLGIDYRSGSGRQPKASVRDSKPAQRQAEPDSPKPLIIERHWPDDPSGIGTPTPTDGSPKRYVEPEPMRIEAGTLTGVELAVGSLVRIRIDACCVSDLAALVREMEAAC